MADRDKIEAGFRRLAEDLEADERTADRHRVYCQTLLGLHRLGCYARRRPWRWVWGAIAAVDNIYSALSEGRRSGLGVRESLRGFLADAPGCTGVAASWCPRCGDCTCPDRGGYLPEYSSSCPLHALDSPHGVPDDDEPYAYVNLRALRDILRAEQRAYCKGLLRRHREHCARRPRPLRWVWGAIAAWDCVRLAVCAGKARGLGLVDSLRGFV